MGWFRRKDRDRDVRTTREEAAEERAEVREKADALVLKNKVLQLGREIEAHATVLKARAEELRKEVERGTT